MERTVEYFIEKVRSRPCLWNQSHVSYRDVVKKDCAWERIARECRLASGREAKLQWKKLRDSHREALRRRKPSHGPSAQYLRPWKYEEDMKFIVSQMENKESTYYSPDSNDIEDAVDDNSPKEIPVPPLIKFNTSKHDSMNIDLLDADPDKKRDIIELLEDREKLREDRERHRDELLIQAVAISRSDAMSKFFDSLCQKTRELPKYLQLRVQREVFESVTRAEEEALSLNPSPIDVYCPIANSSSQNADAGESQEQDAEEQDSEYERKFSIEGS